MIYKIERAKLHASMLWITLSHWSQYANSLLLVVNLFEFTPQQFNKCTLDDPVIMRAHEMIVISLTLSAQNHNWNTT